MSPPFVHITVDGRIATIRFDRGDGVSALSAEAIRQLTLAARDFHARPDISAVILSGGPKNFTLGADLKDPASAALRKQGLADRRLSLRAGPDLCEAWERIDALTIVAIEGWCVGGGAALAVSCDLRVMGKSARLYVPEIARGMNMSWGSVPRITALVGPARAKRIIALCEQLDAATAHAWGLADAVAEDGQALATALAFARTAAALPPSALKIAKHDINAAALAHSRLTARSDLEAFALLERSDDFAEGIASFLEGRDPDFTGN
ncbi:MAG: enoyl-CoA hydratase/isomerase family protein [Alphaproteobacteria bacterium]|nr:enoyl-CoA hydratase/isomerase family protein [Alphaproteobacteria bacterium]